MYDTIDFDMFVETTIQTVSIKETTQGYDVLISILDHQMNTWILTAYSVVSFHLNYMCLHNIIDYIHLLDETNTTDEDLRKTIFFSLRGAYANSPEELAWERVDKRLQEIKSSKYILLEIEPVSGAYILLIAENISLWKEDEEPVSPRRMPNLI